MVGRDARECARRGKMNSSALSAHSAAPICCLRPRPARLSSDTVTAMNRRQWLSLVASILPASRLGLHAQPPAFEDILKIDVHSHVFEDIPSLVTMLRRN